MGRDAVSQVRPDSARALQTFWDGRVVVDVTSADYDCEAQLPNYWVRGIEVGDTSSGNIVIVDHADMEGAKTAQPLYCAQGAIKAPLPVITKIVSSGTTVAPAKIALYYQRKRA